MELNHCLTNSSRSRTEQPNIFTFTNSRCYNTKALEIQLDINIYMKPLFEQRDESADKNPEMNVASDKDSDKRCESLDKHVERELNIVQIELEYQRMAS